MGKILNGLKALGQKMTGRPIQSNKIGNALNEIAENYSGGSGGGGANFTAYPIGKIDQMETFNEAGFDFALIGEEGLSASTAKVYVED